MKGQIGFQSTAPSLRIKEIIAEKDALRRLAKCITIQIEPSQEETKLLQIREIIKKHSGTCPLFFELSTPEQTSTVIRASSQYFVTVTDAFLSSIHELLGQGACRINQADLLAMV